MKQPQTALGDEFPEPHMELPPLPPESQEEPVPPREMLQPVLLMLLVVCVLGAIASCIVNGLVRP